MSPASNRLLSQLPATVDPIQLAENGARLVGALSRKAMTRLTQACSDDTGEVRVDLQFGRGEGGNMLELRGNVHAAVRVACQRCLEPMTLELHADTRLLLLRPGVRTDTLAQEVEALTVDRPVSLSELVEDELLLMLPMVPMHPLDACPAKEQLKMPAATRTGKPLSALRR